MAVRSVMMKNRLASIFGHDFNETAQKSRFSIAELRNLPQIPPASESSSAYSSDKSEESFDEDTDKEELVELKTPIDERKAQNEERKQQLLLKKYARVEYLRKHLRFTDTLTAVVGVCGVFVAFYENQLFYDENNPTVNRQASPLENGLRGFVTVSTCVLLILIAYRTKLAYEVRREKKVGAAAVSKPFLQSWMFKAMWLELVLNVVHWPPFVDGTFEFTQMGGTMVVSYDAIFTTCTLVRFYLILRLFEHYTKWSTRIAEMACEEFGCEADTEFALKATLKERPLLVLGFFVAFTLTVCGLAAWQFEKPYTDENLTTGQDFDYIWNCLWMMVLAMTTVGYGDFFPRTHIGRFFVVVATMSGVFLISLIVVTMTVASQFSLPESKAYNLLYRLNAKEQARNEAAYAVMHALKIRVLQRKLIQDSEKEMAWQRHHMSQRLVAFKREQNKALHSSLTDEEMLRQLTEKVNLDMEEISQHIKVARELTAQVEKIEKCQKVTMEALVNCWKNSHELSLKID